MNWPSNSKSSAESSLNREQIADLNQRFSELDNKLGFDVGDDFKQFDQINDVFSRAFWDEGVKSKDTDGFFASYRMEFAPRRGDGFNQKDFAFRNASWAISDLISDRAAERGKREGFQSAIEVSAPVAKDAIEICDADAESREIKEIAKMFGADLVGICEIDQRWHYATRVDTRDFSSVPNDIPTGCTHVIVMGHAMDVELVDTYPSALAGASTGMEYSHEASIVIQLATYIRNLGYEAVGSMNDTALVIPYAIKAGLGEYGRNQMVLTPEFGPRVRFSKIFTSLPLVSDEPETLGINQYCQICTKCADACPPKALPFGNPSDEPQNKSTITGVKKWSANCEKCFSYWAKLKTDCAICMRVCPFNKTPQTKYSIAFWRDALWFKLATSRFRKIARRWDDKFGARQRTKPKNWWKNLSAK